MNPQPIEDLIQRLRKLPGVGEKTATRYALHLATHGADAADLGVLLSRLKDAVGPCPDCLATIDLSRPCGYCARTVDVLCVVHRYVDLLAVERAAPGAARYFVLGQVLSPLGGVGESELPIAGLLAAVAPVREVVLALPATVDGQATTLLLAQKLTAAGKQVSTLARGIAHGADLEFADPITMRGAFDGRVRVGEPTTPPAPSGALDEAIGEEG